MIILSRDEFLSRKSSDTLVILGSGSSINQIPDKQWKKVSSYDSVGFNWFCHHHFGPTFYAIREQANNKYRNVETETRKMLFKEMRKKSYRNTCLILHDVSKHSRKAYSYAKNSREFSQSGIIVKDLKHNSIRKKFFEFDIFNKGCFHWRISLANVIHIGLFLKYKKFIFVGIDLYNSRYFWLPGNKIRSNINRAKKSNKHVHPVAPFTLKLLQAIKRLFDVKMVTGNKKSHLCQIMPYEDI